MDPELEIFTKLWYNGTSKSVWRDCGKIGVDGNRVQPTSYVERGIMMDKIKYGPLTLELDEDAAEPGYRVTACDKNAVEVEIPRRVGEYNVTAIGESAFEDCAELLSVVLPEPNPETRWEEACLSKIGEYAFSGCTSLVTVNIPDTVGNISRGAFHGCTALVAVTFDSDTYVGAYAFCGCRSLVSLPPLGSVSEGMLRDCTSLMSVTLTGCCTEIDEDAFEHCEALCQVVIPARVKRIEALAFRSCRALTRVVFENSEGWYANSCYHDREVKLDLTDPVRNARWLSGMDFDDGVQAWYRKE